MIPNFLVQRWRENSFDLIDFSQKPTEIEQVNPNIAQLKRLVRVKTDAYLLHHYGNFEACESCWLVWSWSFTHVKPFLHRLRTWLLGFHLLLTPGCLLTAFQRNKVLLWSVTCTLPCWWQKRRACYVNDKILFRPHFATICNWFILENSWYI